MYILSENELYCKHETEMHFFLLLCHPKEKQQKTKTKNTTMCCNGINQLH